MRRRTAITAVGSGLLSFSGCLGGMGSALLPRESATLPDSIESEWPVPGYDPGRSNYSPAASGPTGPIAHLWQTALDTTLAGPVLAAETIYVGGDDGVVRALDAITGTVEWRAAVDAPAGSPWVVDGTCYVPTDRGIVALEATDGTRIWSVETPTRILDSAIGSGYYEKDCFFVAEHGVYFVAVDRTPAVVALDRSTGNRRWRTEIVDPWRTPMFATAEYLFVSTGTYWDEPWIFDVSTGENVGDDPPEGLGGDLEAEQFSLDSVVYAADPMFGEVDATSVRDGGYGQSIWSRNLDAHGGFALSGGRENIYFAAERGPLAGLLALSISGGSTVWSDGATTHLLTRPVVTANVVVVATERTFHGFAPADGRKLWSYAGPGIGPQYIVCDDLLFAVIDGTIRAFRSLRE